LAEIINCSKADRRKQLTFPNELGELPASMRWEVQEGAILENNSVDVTVRIPSDYSDGARDAKRLERTKRAGPFRTIGSMNLPLPASPAGVPSALLCWLVMGANMNRFVIAGPWQKDNGSNN
jgi:hypothetical protein